MIVISGALVLVALVLLVIGLIQPDLAFVYASIGVSIASFVFLFIGVLQRRREGVPAAEGVEAVAGTDDAAAPTVLPVIGGTARRPAVDPSADALLDDINGTVFVVEGRPRYHLENCRYLVGKDAKPIAVRSALSDGFTACGVCKPNFRLDVATPAPSDDLVDAPLDEAELDATELDSAELVETDVVEAGLAETELAEVGLVESDTWDAEPAAAELEQSDESLTDEELVEEESDLLDEPAELETSLDQDAPVEDTLLADDALLADDEPTAVQELAPAAVATKAARATKAAAVRSAPTKSAAKSDTAKVAPVKVAPAKVAPVKVAPVKVAPVKAAPVKAKAARVIVIPDRGKFHAAGCRYVRGVESAVELPRATATKQGYAACGVCKP